MNTVNVVATIFVYLVTIYCINKGHGKLKTQAKAFLYHLLSRLLIAVPLLTMQLPIFKPLVLIPIYIFFWIPAVLGLVALVVYLKRKESLYKYFFVFTLLFYLFGRSQYFTWAILGYLFLSLYNQKTNRQKR